MLASGSDTGAQLAIFRDEDIDFRHVLTVFILVHCATLSIIRSARFLSEIVVITRSLVSSARPDTGVYHTTVRSATPVAIRFDRRSGQNKKEE